MLPHHLLDGEVYAAVMVLTPKTMLHPEVADLISANPGVIDTMPYFGCTNAASQDVRDAVSQILQ